MFFDGTLNHRDNIAARRRWEARRGRPGGATGSRPGGSANDNSYAADDSNVAKLEQTLATEQPGYNHAIKIYVEGIGTEKGGGDSRPGYAFGTLGTGVIKKVESGIIQLVRRIARTAGSPADVRIVHIHLDAVGFSRGAAAARNFIHQAVNAGQLRIRNQLQRQG